MAETLEVKDGLTYSVIDGINTGLKTGTYKEYSESGDLIHFSEYKDGLLDGTSMYYRKNGERGYSETYEKGRLDSYVEYDEYGFTRDAVKIWGPGEHYHTYYLRETPVYSGLTIDGNREGTWTFKELDGSVYFKEYENNRLNGPYELIKEGERLEEGFYKNGKLDGTRIIYYPDDLYSQSRIEIEYLAGEIISEKHYGPEGELIYSIKY